MQCPKCDAQNLATASVNGIEVEQCPRCQGIWFDECELTRLLALKPSDFAALERGRLNPALDATAGRCPRDQDRLLRVASARNRTVTIEVCPRCRGIWLDGGELAAITQRG